MREKGNNEPEQNLGEPPEALTGARNKEQYRGEEEQGYQREKKARKTAHRGRRKRVLKFTPKHGQTQTI